MEIKFFTFNEFLENTYVLFDETRECIIIDPGCNNDSERKALMYFIEEHQLTPKHVINTHCHIDHILGNQYVCEKFHLALESHEGEEIVLSSAPQVAQMYGIDYTPSPKISHYLIEGAEVKFGNTTLEIIETPGHSPASISLYCREKGILICGDVLFSGSIGRTDLPGGNYNLLISIISEKFFTLDDQTKVYPGHGPMTTIGIEKATNPFF
ncbi:MAG: MBL fold metallo-hydrolase [Lewinellaceae bacterium]|nr:MBL fold metallo-hydrolase [Lewinellaceae bacterium]